MARFFGGIKGNRGEVTRLGSKDSGLRTFNQGWNAGVEVVAMVEDGVDCFYVYANRGSNGDGRRNHIATVKKGPDGSGIVLIGDFEWV